MRLTLLKPIWYGGKMLQAGEELDMEQTGEVRTWFALGWVKKAELQTRAMTTETAAPLIVENPPWEKPAAPVVENPLLQEEQKSNIDPLTGRRRYRRRDMKADE